MANQLSPTRAGSNLQPRSSFEMLQQQIDRMFDDFAMGLRPGFFSSMGQNLMPSIDMHQGDDGKVIVTAELPGVNEEDVNISVDDDVLTISGEKKSAIDSNQGNQRHAERIYGKFSRTVALPFDVDPEKVDARFDNGVLTLTIEKPTGADEHSHRIQIRH